MWFNRFISLMFLLFFQTPAVLSSENKTTFHIGALVPYLHMGDYFGFKTAIDLAVERIHNTSLLGGHKMVVHYKETRGNEHEAIEALIDFKRMNSSQAIKTFIIGPSKSSVASYTARLATVWDQLQVSYGASTPELLDGTVYPRFLTTVPTSNSLNKAAIEMLKYFKWKRVGLVYDVNDKDFFLPTMNKLQAGLHAGNFNIMVEEGISADGDDRAHIIKTMKKQDVRIVIALFKQTDMRKVMCEAYRQGFYGQRIVWMTYMARIKSDAAIDGCNASELSLVTNGMFIFDLLYLRTDQKKTSSGLTVKQFHTAISSRRSSKQSRPIPRISLAFDTTWLIALALNASLEDAVELQTRGNNKNVELEPGVKLLERIKEKMKKLEFEGISGNVKFNNTERFGTVIIFQERNGKLVGIAQHHTSTDILTFMDNRTSTALLEGDYVRDGPLDVYEVYYYSAVLSIVIWIVCSLAIIIAIGLYYFNFKNREIRYIKMSSPHLNNIIILGGLLCYIKVILDTLDSKFMSLEMYGTFCNIRVWIMSLGFTTAFGAMFSKTWRVHRIFTASQNFRRAVIKNFHLYGLLVGLLAVDITLLTLWMVFSPYKYDILKLPVQVDEDRDEILHPSIYHCTSEHSNYFLITTFCYKGLLLIFGIFLAWETRNIEIKALNDSKYIGMSVYNVVILSVVGVLIASLMAGTKRYDLYLALMSVDVILCTAATLGIVFVPKIIGLQRILDSTSNKRESSFNGTTHVDSDSPCCCCENCKCRCRRRSSSVHVSNKFLASASQNRRKSSSSRKPHSPIMPSMPSISVTKPKVSVHIDARVSLSTCREGEETPSPDESPRVGFLGAQC